MTIIFLLLLCLSKQSPNVLFPSYLELNLVIKKVYEQMKQRFISISIGFDAVDAGLSCFSQIKPRASGDL